MKVIEWHHNTVILALADGCLLELLVVKNDISDNQPNQPFNGHHEIIPSYRLEIVSKFRTKSSTPTQTILSLSFESNLLAVLDT